MEFLDKLGKKASETYKYTTEKTSKIAKEAKLKMAMNEKKAEIEELYTKIGKKVYERHIVDDGIDIDLESLLEENCIEIDELCDRIEEERKELLNLKDKKQCPNCFYEINIDFNYCPNCGDKQEIDIVEQKKENDDTIKDKEQIKNEENETGK